MIMVYQLISREKKEIVFNEIILAVTKLSAMDIKGTIHVAHLILFFDYMMHSCYSTESNDIIKQVLKMYLTEKIFLFNLKISYFSI